MSAHSPERFEDLPILAELRDALTAHYRAAGAHAHSAHAGRSHRWRALAVVAVVVLGGTTGALAAAGVLRIGSPFGAGSPQTPTALDGVNQPGGVKLLAISVPDPHGGPAWGLRMERTTRGLICLSYGRRADGMLGALGIDGAFHDDGRFHPLSAKATGHQGCATIDGAGHGFLSASVLAEPASALDGSCHGTAASLYPAQLRARRPGIVAQTRKAARGDRRPVCSPAQLRNLYFGMLGPDAVSVTYPSPSGKPATERTVGADGAYLVLGPPSNFTCEGQGCAGGDGGSYSFDPALTPGFITSVAYRDGSVCRLAALQRQQDSALARYQAAFRARFPSVAQDLSTGHLTPAARATFQSAAFNAFQRAHRAAFGPPSCPLRGYVAPHVVRVSAAQVASPVHIATGKVTQEYCKRGSQRTPCGWPAVPVTITYTARVAVTNIESHYETTMNFTPQGHCSHGYASGQFGSTNSDLRAGQRIVDHESVSACPGVIHGEVRYSQNSGASTDATVAGGTGQSQGVLVGRFSFRVPVS